MSLDMRGHIDNTFQSVVATRLGRSGTYVDGIYVQGIETPSSHVVNVQPLTDREIQFLEIGAERIIDTRKIYVNDGDMYSITPADNWLLETISGVFETIALDNRPWHNYCKVIVSRRDDS